MRKSSSVRSLWPGVAAVIVSYTIIMLVIRPAIGHEPTFLAIAFTTVASLVIGLMVGRLTKGRSH